MLHQRLEPVTKTFRAATRSTLNDYANEIEQAKTYAEIADRIRGDVRGALVDLFGAITDGGSTAYHIDDGPQEGNLLCLDLAVRYEPDMAHLANLLGDRLQFVTETKPVFNRKKAEAAIKTGVVTEAEMARCVKAVARPSVMVRRAQDATAPKGIEPGEARVTPLKLPRGLKLDWG